MRAHFRTRRPSGAGNAAFTLIELFVAMVILALLVVLLSGLVGQLVKLTQFSSSQTERLEKAGTAMDLIRRDLTGAILPLPFDAQNGLQFLSGSGVLVNISDDVKRPHAMFWQAPVASDATRGDLSVIGYFIRWDDSVADNPRAKLCRLKIDAAKFQEAGVDFSKEWVTDEILEANASASEPNYEGFIVDDVIALWIRVVSKDGIFAYEFDSRTKTNLPVRVEVAMVVIDDRAAELVSQVPAYAALHPNEMEAEMAQFLSNLPPRVREGARIFKTTFMMENVR